MIRLGERQTLEIVRKKEFGVYVANPESDSNEAILLPKKEVPEWAEVGDKLEVFVYRDSSDRLIATTTQPLIALGEVKLLKVKQITKIGAFLDWGLQKDLMLPFKEQLCPLREGQDCLVALYIDKSKRLCATMKIYTYLKSEAPYKKDDRVSGYIYQLHPEYGAFVAVDGMYHGLIPSRELHGNYAVGDAVNARVYKVREDGKLELSLREKVQFQIDVDAAKIMSLIESYDGVLPFTEKASPAVIERETGLSKAAFKRAVGRLLKNGKIEINQLKIRKVEEK